MKILLADKDFKTTSAYKTALEERKHHVVISNDIEECLKTYHDALNKIRAQTDLVDHIQPFDAVIIDYKISELTGIEAAKEILIVNPRQRIIIATDCITNDLIDSIKKLENFTVELLQKPSGDDIVVSLIEEKEIFIELRKLDINIEYVKSAQLRHEQMISILNALRKSRKNRRRDFQNNATSIH
jgi:DNA-binding response OmpR family regulator